MNLIEYLTQVGKENKTWEEVGEMFGISGTAARKRWYRVKDEFKDMDKKTKESSKLDKFLEEFTVPSGMKINSLWEDAKGNVKFSLKSEKEQIEDVDLEQKLKDVIDNYIPKSFKSIFPGKGKYSDETLIVFTSDKHIGASMDKEGIYNIDYNEDVFRRRMEYIAQYIIDKSIVNDGYKDVIIFDLGDALDGYEGHTTRGGHLLPQNLTTEEQWDVYVETHQDFIHTLVEHDVAETIHFYCTSNANHSGPFEYTAMKSTCDLLSARYGNRVVTDVSRDFLTNYQVYSPTGYINYIITHGKDKKYMNRGYPLHMNDKIENQINQYLERNDLLGEQVVFVKGDLHQCAMEKLRNFEYINVPSIFGSSDWIVHNFGLTNPATYCEIIDSEGQRQQTFIDLSHIY